MSYFMFIRPFHAVFEGDNTVETLTTKVNDLNTQITTLTEERDTFKTASEQATQKVENLKVEVNAHKSKADLASKDNKTIVEQVTTLGEELKTAKALGEQGIAKLQKKYDKDLGVAQDEASGWKGRYAKEIKENNVIRAVEEYKGLHSEQFLSLLMPKAKLVEKVDDDQPTGEFDVKISMAFEDDDGKESVLTLSPREAVKKMKDTDRYANLFEGEGSGGLHRHSGRAGQTGTAADIAKQGSAAYRKAREDGTISFK